MNINLFDAIVLGMGFVFGATIASVIIGFVGFIVSVIISILIVALSGA